MWPLLYSYMFVNWSSCCSTTSLILYENLAHLDSHCLCNYIFVCLPTRQLPCPRLDIWFVSHHVIQVYASEFVLFVWCQLQSCQEKGSWMPSEEYVTPLLSALRSFTPRSYYSILLSLACSTAAKYCKCCLSYVKEINRPDGLPDFNDRTCLCPLVLVSLHFQALLLTQISSWYPLKETLGHTR